MTTTPQIFDGARVLLTGGTRGIGVGILDAFVEAGADVVYAARTDSPDTDRSRRSGRAGFVAIDLSDPDAPPALIAAAVSRLGGVDVLVHCAGIYPETPLEEMTASAWNTVLQVNLTSGALLLSAFAAQAGRGARAVMISSITGPRTALPGLAHYAASKGGIDGLVRAAAYELAPRGITVNAVAPGSVLTPALEELLGEEGIAATAQKIPTGRLGHAADIAAAVLFLASPGAAFITGQSLVVDGGQTLVELF